eukprot:3970112-Pyramimonas_sp.AAC.1
MDRVVKITSQCVEAVWHLHAVVQVCHRDIKPENISRARRATLKDFIDDSSLQYSSNGPNQ